MLILGREVGQSVRIGDDIKVTVVHQGSKLKLAVDAPKNTRISRVNQNQLNAGKDNRKNRRIGETIMIGENVEIALIQTISGTIRFAIKAPKEIGVFREEIYKSNMTLV